MKQKPTQQTLALQGKIAPLQSNDNTGKTTDNTPTDEQVWSRLLKREVEVIEAALFAEALTGFFVALIQAQNNTQHG